MIDDVISPNCLVKLAQKEKITLQKQLDPSVVPYVAHLRRSISILFNFVRKLSPNKVCRYHSNKVHCFYRVPFHEKILGFF